MRFSVRGFGCALFILEKYNMKKVISMLLALSMMFALCACGGHETADKEQEIKPDSFTVEDF